MKVFVSWSGDLSRKIAALLKERIPCFIQSVDVFYSPDDIEKGENWDSKISHELEEANFGIICLTSQNKAAQWINFEAGAIAKSLDSRVSALMININPSDIKGPLSRYQATKIDHDDFLHLIQSINNATECPLSESILKRTFEGLWSSFKADFDNIVAEYRDTKKMPETIQTPPNEILEEILQNVRKQSAILTDLNLEKSNSEKNERLMAAFANIISVIREMLEYTPPSPKKSSNIVIKQNNSVQYVRPKAISFTVYWKYIELLIATLETIALELKNPLIYEEISKIQRTCRSIKTVHRNIISTKPPSTVANTDEGAADNE